MSLRPAQRSWRHTVLAVRTKACRSGRTGNARAARPSYHPGARSGWRDWAKLFATALPGLAAVVALAFTAQSLRATNTQLAENRDQADISEQGQITDRFNAAIRNLASANQVVQLGGIYALQRIMTDSIRDQPAIVNVLSGYVRYHDSLPGTPAHRHAWPQIHRLAAGIQAALVVIGARDPAFDGSAVVDLQNTDLAGMQLPAGNLSGANLQGADLAGAFLADAKLAGANITHANLTDANLERADLQSAKLVGAQMTCPGKKRCADFAEADLDGAYLENVEAAGAVFLRVSLVRAHLDDADFSGGDFSEGNLEYATLAGATLSSAYFNDTDLRYASLLRANLSHANLKRSNLRNVNLAYAKLDQANLDGADLRGGLLAQANLTHANLTGAKLAGVEMTGAALTGAKGLPRQ